MNSIPKISVLIISYKQEDFIARALNSLVSQQEYLYEICINDDASPDGTWDIIMQYKEKYPELIKPVRNEVNLGIFQNVEAVWKRPIGDMVYILAGDDECPQGYFKQVIDFIIEKKIDYLNEAICIYGDYIQKNADGKSVLYKNNVKPNSNAIKLKLRKLLYGRGACFSKKVLDRFENVSEGRSYSVELTQDCQLQLFADKNYHIPCVGNIYYAQIGVSTILSKADYKPNISESYDKFIKFVASHGKPLDKKDLAYIEYMKAFRSGKIIKTVGYYIKSFDVTLGVDGLQLNRISFVFKNRILHNIFKK